MTYEEMETLFEGDDGLGAFELIQNKRSSRPDIHAFILLNELFPGEFDIVSAAGHDQIWLDIEPNALAEKATPEQIIELRRCGVWLDGSTDSLSMFV